MSAREDHSIVQTGGQMCVSLCSEGHVHLRMRGEAVSFDIPLDSREAASLGNALLQAAADAKAVEQGASAATH